MNTMNSGGYSIQKAIQAAMEDQTKKIVEEEARKAGERVEERVRGMVGQIAINIASHVSYESFRDSLVVTVRLPNQDAAARSKVVDPGHPGPLLFPPHPNTG